MVYNDLVDSLDGNRLCGLALVGAAAIEQRMEERVDRTWRSVHSSAVRGFERHAGETAFTAVACVV